MVGYKNSSFILAVLMSMLFCFSNNSMADEIRVMTWESSLEEAKINNPDLVSAKEQVNGSQAQQSIVKSESLPQINSSLSASTTKASGSDRSAAYSYGVTGKQLLFDGLKLHNDVRAAASTLEATQYNYQVVSSNVRLNLRVAFIELLNAQQSLQVAEGIAKRRKQSVDMVNLQYQSGSEHKGSLLTAEANEEQALYDIESAKRDIALSQRRFVKAMGWKNFVPMVAQGDLSVISVDKNEPKFEALIASVPLLNTLVARKEAAKYNLASAKSSLFPSIYANASAGRSDEQWPPTSSSLSAGLSVSFPIFQGGQTQAQITKSRAMYAQSQADERSGKDGVIFTLAQTWTQWQDGVDNAKVQHKFLEAALERSKIAHVQYSSGSISFNDWIIIEDSLVNAEKRYLSAQSNALIALANWEQAKGVMLDE